MKRRNSLSNNARLGAFIRRAILAAFRVLMPPSRVTASPDCGGDFLGHWDVY